ncbi:hypothetical protein [Winogradskyella poriferorum]|uniref:hypothetical protein n=1 Tax=Winogradskyella poriferorum TaxID=307627 RepID=UPI003D659EE2
MINLFRKIRKNLFDNKVTSYFFYALGEIFLVMVGILLALYVNNLNEEKKQDKQLKTILKTVRADLVTDTLVATEIIKFYDSINKYSNKIINKEYSKSNIEECLLCRSLTTLYQPLTIQDKGYLMLKSFNQFDMNEADSLQLVIIQYYKSSSTIIEQSNEFIKSETLKNLDYLKSKDWFVNWMQGQFTDEMREFFGESTDYRNRVASNLILASSNHSRFVSAHKNGAVELINRIDTTLKSD